MAETSPDTDSARRRHEAPEVQIRLILLCGLGLVVITLIVFLVSDWLFAVFAARRAQVQVPPPPLAETQQPPPEPRLQIVPAQDLQQMRAAEEAVLSSYGWVDQAAGLVRIPIDRALDLAVERGLPVWRAHQAPQGEERVPGSQGEGR